MSGDGFVVTTHNPSAAEAMIRVDVAAHFNEDAFSYGLVHGLANRLRDALQLVECSTHGEESSVRVSTEGVAQTLNDITIETTGCCEAVTRQVQQIIDEIRHGEESS